jgi:hypothetical protein
LVSSRFVAAATGVVFKAFWHNRASNTAAAVPARLRPAVLTVDGSLVIRPSLPQRVVHFFGQLSHGLDLSLDLLSRPLPVRIDLVLNDLQIGAELVIFDPDFILLPLELLMLLTLNPCLQVVL